MVSLWLKFMDWWPRHGQCAYMCLTTRTLAMTEKEVWQAPRQCALLCLTARTLTMMRMKQYKFSAQKKEVREAPLFRIKLRTA